MKRAILLDLDGTLTDSAPALCRAVAYALARLGLPAQEETALRASIGPSLRESFPRFGVPPERMEEAIALFIEGYHENDEGAVSVYEGVPDMLAAFRDMGFTLALATAKPLDAAERITAEYGLAPYLDAQFGAKESGGLIDKHDLMISALRETGAEPSRSFMIGDRRHDMEGALKAGAAPLGALWGYGSADELKTAGALRLLASPKDAPGAIKELIT